MLYVLAMMECCWVTAVGPCTPSRPTRINALHDVPKRARPRYQGAEGYFIESLCFQQTKLGCKSNLLAVSFVLVSDSGALGEST